jgi:aminopeptidase
MLTERHLENYADVLWWGLSTARRQRFRKNDVVQIRFHASAVRLTEILYRKLLEKGLNPVPRLSPTPDMERSFYRLSGNRQLVFVPPGEERFAENLSGSIFLNAPESLTHLRDADPRKIGRATVAHKLLRAVLERREAQGAYSWTLCMLPTAELARQAGLGVQAYSRQVVRACFLDAAAPVSAWKAIHRRAGEIKRWLDGMPVARFRVESDGTDLELALGAKRRWAGVSGRNIPSFELFVSPDWRGTRGVFYADQPSFRNGNIVRQVRLEFRNGRLARAGAKEGVDFLKNQLALDPGASRVGEFSLTDRRFSRIDRFMANTLFDENYGGTHGNCHIALGSSYGNTYAGDPRRLTGTLKDKLGFNDSALHWDFVNTEKKRVTAILADGSRVVVYENGEFSR